MLIARLKARNQIINTAIALGKPKTKAGNKTFIRNTKTQRKRSLAQLILGWLAKKVNERLKRLYLERFIISYLTQTNKNKGQHEANLL
jgi:hypothetical protein